MQRKSLLYLGRALWVLIFAYFAIGLGFHIAWENAREACRSVRAARGEFVEPEVFGGVIGVAFDMVYWPVYAWANWYHFGAPFATPCMR